LQAAAIAADFEAGGGLTGLARFGIEQLEGDTAGTLGDHGCARGEQGGKQDGFAGELLDSKSFQHGCTSVSHPQGRV
jgi:hypothetical protein